MGLIVAFNGFEVVFVGSKYATSRWSMLKFFLDIR